MDIQDAMDEPAFHTEHFPSSLYPRIAGPSELVVESLFEESAIEELRARGHRLRLAVPWSLGNITAVRIDDQAGWLEASASSRGQRAYAIGW